jgi:hypothetical protein
VPLSQDSSISIWCVPKAYCYSFLVLPLAMLGRSKMMYAYQYCICMENKFQMYLSAQTVWCIGCFWNVMDLNMQIDENMGGH